jgi:hypothetical protein
MASGRLASGASLLNAINSRKYKPMPGLSCMKSPTLSVAQMIFRKNSTAHSLNYSENWQKAPFSPVEELHGH